MDHEEALLQQDHYCKMVANGLWPDYNGVYKDECLDLGYPAVPRPSHPGVHRDGRGLERPCHIHPGIHGSGGVGDGAGGVQEGFQVISCSVAVHEHGAA